jgi:hypothetical protein
MSANNNNAGKSSSSFNDKLIWFLQASVHAVILMGPIFYSNILHNSDSMLHHAPTHLGDFDTANNITDIGFSIRRFSSKGTEDISFSHEQQDDFGDTYTAAHVTYHVLVAFMWIALLAPSIFGLLSKCFSCYEDTRAATCKEVAAKRARTYGKVVSPIMILLSILMVVPFMLLINSDLCGPSYMELQFGIEVDSSDSSSSDENSKEYYSYENDHHHHHHGCGGPDYEGTIAVFHEEIPATCTIGSSGIGFLCLTLMYPLVLIAHAYFLMKTADRLESEISSDRASNTEFSPPVIKVNDVDDVDDDKTEDGSTIGENCGA